MLIVFLKTGTTFAFFHSERNFPFSKHDLKIVPIGLLIDSSQLFNIRILTISWPSQISYVENSTDENDLHVFLVRTEGCLLLYLQENTALSSAFSLKSMMNLPLCNRGGMQDIFLLFRKIFNIDQYDFGLVFLFKS